MIEFQGSYFDGKNSKSQPVAVLFDGAALIVRSYEGPLSISAPLASCDIIPPLGKLKRSIRFPDGGLLETDDVEAVNALEQLAGGNRGMRVVHYLESRWKAVACCVIALLLCFWMFTKYGIPLIAERVAYAIPVASMEKVSQDTVKIMDKRYLNPSALSPEKTRKVERLFRQVSKDLGKGYNYRLVLRKGKGIGANAFALPSGIIVVSDELVALAEDDRQLAGVLAHEVAHVQGRHVVRQLLQSAGVLFIISVMAGDIASISSTAASLPTLLVQTGYSREFEKQADREAALYSIRKGWGTAPYKKMLGSLHKGTPELFSIPFLSTHPTLTERLKYIDGLEKTAQN